MLGFNPLASAPLAAVFVRDPFIAAAGAYVVAGQNVGLQIGRHLVTAAGAYVYSGGTVTLKPTAEPTGGALLAFGPMMSYPLASTQNTITVYSLNLAAGAYTSAGQAVATKYGRHTVADVGNYLISSNVVSLRTSIKAALGTYAVNGQDVRLAATRKLTAGAGAYTSTGFGITLKFGHKVTAALGAYVLTGKAVELIAPRKIYPDSGIYLYTGQAAALRATRKHYPAAGAYVLSGKMIEFVFGFDLKSGKYIRLEGFHESEFEFDGFYRASQRLGGPKE